MPSRSEMKLFRVYAGIQGSMYEVWEYVKNGKIYYEIYKAWGVGRTGTMGTELTASQVQQFIKENYLKKVK